MKLVLVSFILILAGCAWGKGTLVAKSKPKPKPSVDRLAPSSGLNFGLIMYGEDLKLTDTATSKIYPMKSLNYGMFTSYKKINRGEKRDSHWDIGLAYGLANVDSDNNEISYFKSGVPFLAILGEWGLLFKPSASSNFSMGFDFPAIVKYANYQQPTTTASFVKTAFAMGIAFEVNLYLGRSWYVNQKIGTGYGFRDPLWIVSLSWLSR